MTRRKFNCHEKDVVYSSLAEIIKIWVKGSGNANFSLNVVEGNTELNIKITLGSITLPSQQVIVDATSTDIVADNPMEKQRKRKSPSQRKRNYICAKEFQKRKYLKQNIQLPFTGNLLPVNRVVNTQDADETTVTEVEVLATPPQPHLPSPHKVAVKRPQSKDRITRDDMLSAKKILFHPNSNSQAEPIRKGDVLKNVSTQASYQTKESELWTKIFK